MITKLNLEQAGRAFMLCFMANIPVALWGGVGIGKSSLIAQVVAMMNGFRFYDIRLSDKLSSDFGAPYPNTKTGKLDFMATSLLPFDCEEKCVVLFDEYDRVPDINVQNMTLQLVLDRTLNGHKLSKNARIVLAGNGSSDMGTSPLSKAAATRMVHLYVEGESEGALESYLKWAEGAGISPMMRSFARYRKEVWCAKDGDGEMGELALPRKRTFDMADRLITVSEKAQFETKDILRAVVEGCVGSSAAVEVLGWHQQYKDAPSIEQIIASPDTAKLPVNLGVYYALTLTVTEWLSDAKNQRHAELMCKYGLRWPEEQGGYLFRRIEVKCPRAITTNSYLQWIKRRAK